MVHGLGVNDCKLPAKDPRYIIWKAMLGRCNPLSKSYRGSTCCEEWLKLSNFLVWLNTQDYIGKHLDKDLLGKGDKEYNPDVCVFLPPKINTAIKSRYKNKTEYPSGITYYQQKYQVKVFGKHLGMFSTLVAASEAREEYRKKIFKDLANTVDNPKVKQALLNFK